MGGEQSTVGRWEVEDGVRKHFFSLSPLPDLGIALSPPIRKLMQLSVLILGSSFYSLPFFSSFFSFHSVQH